MIISVNGFPSISTEMRSVCCVMVTCAQSGRAAVRSKRDTAFMSDSKAQSGLSEQADAGGAHDFEEAEGIEQGAGGGGATHQRAHDAERGGVGSGEVEIADRRARLEPALAIAVRRGGVSVSGPGRRSAEIFEGQGRGELGVFD